MGRVGGLGGAAEALEGVDNGDVGEVDQVQSREVRMMEECLMQLGVADVVGGIEGQWEGVDLGSLVGELDLKLMAKGLEMIAGEGGKVVANVASGEEAIDARVGA